MHFLLREWGALSKDDGLVFVLVGMSSAFGGFLISQAYRKSEAAFVAPFEYTYLVFAILIDYTVWQYIPSKQGIIGVTMIISAGVMIALRERGRI